MTSSLTSKRHRRQPNSYIRFEPISACDVAVVTSLKRAGFAVVHGFPIWKDNRHKLRGVRKLIVEM